MRTQHSKGPEAAVESIEARDRRDFLKASVIAAASAATMDVNAQAGFDPKTDLRATFPRFSLRENLGAAAVQLTPADLHEIETAFSRIEIYGGRMDARQMAQIGQDAN